ncbi:MAG: hypothetical protein ACO2OQ_02740 [Thermofilaceae archaeon]
MVKKPYPRNDDIAEAILEVVGIPTLKPEDLPDRVRRVLEERGFYTGLVTDKRVWRIYETLVRRGRIYDVLGVVQELGEEKEE